MAFRPPVLSTFVTAVITGLLTAGSLLIVGNATIYGDATVRSLTATSTAVGLSVAGRAQIDGNVTTTVGVTPAAPNTGSIGSINYPFATGYFGTSLAVPAITVTSTGAGLTLYNTTDQVTNYERGSLAFSSNELLLSTAVGGSGTSRNLRIAAGWATDGLTLQPGGLGICYFCFNRTTSAANTSIVRITGTQTQSSLVTEGLTIDNTVNQSGSAGYIGLYVNPTLTSEGSAGTKLIDLAIGGTSQFYIDKNGRTYAGGSYGALADGDGYYFGDEVRGLRFVTGDDFEFQNWHVGGQFYMSVYNGSARTRFSVFDAPTKRVAFSDSVDLRNYTPNTSLEVLGTASSTNVLVTNTATSTYFRAATDGTYDVPAIGWLTGEGLTKSGSGQIALTGGGQFLMNLSTGGNSSYVSFNPASIGLDLGSLLLGWRNGFFTGQVSSTSLIASATGTIGYLGLGNEQSHSFNNAILNIKHTPSQAEVGTLDYIQMTNTSSTRDMAISFLDDTETSSILRITAFGREYPSGDFGFSPANMAFFESTSGTIMTYSDGVAVFASSGVFRPITGIGFGNNDNIDPFNATASTTISNGNMSTVALDFPNSAAAGTQDITVTVSGASAGDECQLAGADFAASLFSRADETYTCVGTASNTMTVRRTCVNAVGCGDPASVNANVGFFARQ